MRAIVLCIWAARSPVEHVVSGEVNKLGVELAAGHREITDRETIGNEGRQRLIFRDVYLIVSGRIKHNGGIGVPQSMLHHTRVTDNHLCAVETFHPVAARSEHTPPLNSQPYTAPQNHPT